jgi:hypothetical protein
MSRKKSTEDYEAEAKWVNGCLIHLGSHARKVYILRHGPVPPNTEVCHTCDNGHCINDAHHFLGTHADNMADMSAKGRLKHSKAHKLRMRKRFQQLWRQSGYRNRMLKIYATPESKARRSVVHKGKPKSAVHKARIAAAHIGLHANAAARAAMSNAQRQAWVDGKYASNIGRKRTPEQRKRMSEAQLRIWAERKMPRR